MHYNNMPIISCTAAAFGYDGTPAVTELNFHVYLGDYLCIVGENGSGKSTLIKGLLGLINPLAGQVAMVKNTDIGYLPQQTAITKDFPASTYEVVLSGRLSARGFWPFYTKTDKQIAHQNIIRLGISHKACYRDLSGGQQQRVLLARALCADKKVLLLDEPTAGLDPLFTQDFYTLLKRLNTEDNITVIMVSHDIKSTVAYANHILHLKTQQIFFGTTAEYLHSPIGSAYVSGGTQ